MYDSDSEIWEQIYLESGIYEKGNPIPEVDFDFYIKNISETNIYCSNQGIKRQITEALERNPNREKVVYFYYRKF
jgi:hypothetical protein